MTEPEEPPRDLETWEIIAIALGIAVFCLFVLCKIVGVHL